MAQAGVRAADAGAEPLLEVLPAQLRLAIPTHAVRNVDRAVRCRRACRDAEEEPGGQTDRNRPWHQRHSIDAYRLYRHRVSAVDRVRDLERVDAGDGIDPDDFARRLLRDRNPLRRGGFRLRLRLGYVRGEGEEGCGADHCQRCAVVTHCVLSCYGRLSMNPVRTTLGREAWTIFSSD